MKRVVYRIKGFDCANCALKSERHLNKDERIDSASIDFVGERLFITYKDAPMSEVELIKKIKEVESDDISITKYGKENKPKTKILTAKFWITLTRILVSLAIILVLRFVPNINEVVEIVFYSVALAIVLYDIIYKVFRNIFKLTNPLDEYLLITIASIGAFLMGILGEGEYFEGVMVVILWQVGQLFEDIATRKSKEAISNAIDLRADFANLIDGDHIVRVKPEDLKIGDTIMVRVGEIIPVDGTIIDGAGSLDMSSLTGEPLPVDASAGQNALSGSILTSGSITICVDKVFSDSSISKILELVETSGERKTKTERFITRFARIYTPIVFAIALSFLLIFGFVTNDWAESVYRSLEVLLIGCPCAIVISVPLAYFAGLGLASKNGLVIKGGSYLDDLTKVGVLFVDKTGTLTYGNFQVIKIESFGMNESLFMEYLLAAECRSNHPIAKAICAHQRVASMTLEQQEYEELAGLGVKTIYKNHTIYAGNAELIRSKTDNFVEIDTYGCAIYVAVDGRYVGYVIIGDTVREKAKLLVNKMHELGIKVVLLSGDTKANVVAVANEVGIEEYHYKLLPQDKTEFLEREIEKQKNIKPKKLVAFAGDGINDTPSIIRADIGIAMGGIGSDIAVENADVIIMQDHPLKIYDAIQIGKIARFVAIFNIAFAIFVKVLVLVLSLFGYSNMIIAVLADTGLTIVLVINSLLILARRLKHK